MWKPINHAKIYTAIGVVDPLGDTLMDIFIFGWKYIIYENMIHDQKWGDKIKKY